MGLLGCSTSAPPLVHFAPKTAQIPLKPNEQNKESSESESLRSLVQNRCPSLFTPFQPTWWMNNAHIQTTFSVFADISQVDKIWYRRYDSTLSSRLLQAYSQPFQYRQNLRLVDGGTLGLDFAPIDDSALSDDTPIVVILPGLTGGSYEPNIKSILIHIIKPVEKGGLGYRCSGGVPITSTKFYSAGGTDDFRQALIYISHRYPRAILLGLAFSLGSNIMTRYIAQEGEKSRLASVCVLANPWNLAANSDILSGTFIGRNVYNKTLGTNLMNIAKLHSNVFMADPSLPIAKALSPLMSIPQMTLSEFDTVFLSQVGGPPPEFPYPNLSATLPVPFLAINSADDPVVQDVPMDGSGNGYAVMVLTSGGGHLGWFNDSSGKDRWTTKPVLEWLRLMGEDVMCRTGMKEGEEDLGCKECEGGGLINGNAGVEGIRNRIIKWRRIRTYECIGVAVTAPLMDWFVELIEE
ncbi:AB-hydrolase YheT [Gymnopus androsaceus JB14]|uniref:AB-hydrolase YheT n=1 Tax=Gymnopus androsaceus JB14 TaxID=1447944 RepID=A0A6A4GH89_9AGAR|nr:AB-hydrolase YheT [Gymnopus androsaceus JB14]